jgi:ribokinase
MEPLHSDPKRWRCQVMIGTGGIGSGRFFRLDGHHTLGREESRSGHFLDSRDYCKLHIISHYVKILLGPDFRVIPIGKVGDDEIGHRLLEEMEAIGLDLSHIDVVAGESTLYSICFLYPDGMGGNLTEGRSASSTVDIDWITRAEPEFRRFAGQGIALAAPEVSLVARKRLLEIGTRYSFLRAASFTSAELIEADQLGILRHVDLLSINMHEAAALVGCSVEEKSPLSIVEAAVGKLQGSNPRMRLAITAGVNGNWAWDGEQIRHQEALPVEVVSTAGAGDTFLAALIVGHVADLTFFEAQELATLTAALSVTSPHTIHPHIRRSTLVQCAQQTQASLSEPVRGLLEIG